MQVFILIEVGDIMCGETDTIRGVYATEALASAARDKVSSDPRDYRFDIDAHEVVAG